MAELSVLIPARNEDYLQRTIEEVLAKMRGDTEVIVVLDGYWPNPGLRQHEKVTIVHRPESIGQRAATNEAARISTSRYIMKLDAHCALSEGFDVQLLKAAAELGEDVIQIPAQFNLHVFNWVCPKGHSRYQGRSGPCRDKTCKAPTTKEMVWRPRKSRYSTAWLFDSTLHFQYWGKFKARQVGDYPETMSCLGACWFLSRERFWELDGLDEGHGGWGQMGTEIACKAWLGGGRLVCNKKAWFAHLFRTQGGDFGFPYPLKHYETERAREYSRDLWLNGKWPKAKRPFSWILEHFWPVPRGWTDERLAELKAAEAKRQEKNADASLEIREGGRERGGRDDRDVEPGLDRDRMPEAAGEGPTVLGGSGRVPTKGIVYYSDCRGDETILNAVRAQLARAVNGHAIVSSCLDVVPLGAIRIVHTKLTRSYLTMFKQILAGLELSEADVIFLAEHDVLYHASHFDFTPPRSDLVYYNQNTWKVDAATGRALHYLCKQTSGLCAYRELLLEHYRRRVALVEERGFSRKMGFEPGTHGRNERVDDLRSEAWMSAAPNIDIRHGHNLTPSRWRQDQFRDRRNCRGWTEADEVPGWGVTKGRFAEFLKEAR
jgi:glycosyltransferase involved in cell wall biosynthesis